MRTEHGNVLAACEPQRAVPYAAAHVMCYQTAPAQMYSQHQNDFQLLHTPRVVQSSCNILGHAQNIVVIKFFVIVA